jgi:hypothetical protein
MKRFELVRAGLFTHAKKLAESPNSFFSDTISLENFFQKDNGAENGSGTDENEEDMEEDNNEVKKKGSKGKNTTMLVDYDEELMSNVIQKLIVDEAKRNGYKENELNQFYLSIASDMHSPIHQERLIIINDIFAEISEIRLCPFCQRYFFVFY